MGKEIVFTDVTSQVPEAFYPTPSKIAMPEWIKKLQPYYEWQGKEEQTAKRCLPLLDAVMLGYTIYTTADIRVTATEFDPYFEWSHGLGIKFHAGNQTQTHAKTSFQTPKWMNPWAIKTPPGYSSLFVSPLNHDSLIFQSFSGVVETDTYEAQVHMPFLLSNPKFTGVIEAGTPIAQVFPFARESWKMKVELGMTKEINQTQQLIASKFKNAYRKYFRSGVSFD